MNDVNRLPVTAAAGDARTEHESRRSPSAPTMKTRFPFALTCLLAAPALTATAAAQCFPTWQPGAGMPGVSVPGIADVAFPIPDAPVLAGVALHLQVVPLVLSPAGAIAEFSATNALSLTIGSW